MPNEINLPIYDFAWSPTGKYLAVMPAVDARLDKRPMIYDSRLMLLDSLPNEDAYDVRTLHWNSDGTLLACVITFIYNERTSYESYDSCLRVWDIASRSILVDLTIEDRSVGPWVAWSSLPNIVATSVSGGVTIWDVTSNSEPVFVTLPDACQSIFWNKSGDTLIISTYDGHVVIWNDKSGVNPANADEIRVLDVYGNFLLGQSSDNTLILSDTNTGKSETIPIDGLQYIRKAASSTSGKHIFGFDRSLAGYLWSLDNTMLKDFLDVKCLDWHPTNSWLAIVVKQDVYRLFIWDCETMKALDAGVETSDPIIDLCWHPDGRSLTYLTPEQLRIWHLQ